MQQWQHGAQPLAALMDTRQRKSSAPKTVVLAFIEAIWQRRRCQLLWWAENASGLSVISHRYMLCRHCIKV